ncbi:hypothetical protein GF326_08220 [Candidatus Bathyarchaeota archaeon]|nr:hypothetical protein [Candidatus Bathyarchaeota archaeon]
MTQESFLIIDAGSGSVKSFLVSPQGDLLKSSEQIWNRNTWNSNLAWIKITESIKELTENYEGEILGVTSTSMREEFILLDEKGEEINYTLSDESKKIGKEILKEFGEELYQKSGHWPVPNWIAGAIIPCLKITQPDLFERIQSILMLSDWINYRLTGELATESSGACETSLFDITTADWSWENIQKLDLPRHICPEVLKNGEILGDIDEKISKLTGVSEYVPVIMGGADTQCGLIGMGIKTCEYAAVGGTTTPIQLITDKPLIDEEKRTWSNNHVVEGEWILESNAGYTGRAVKWLRDTFFKEKEGYNELNHSVKKVAIGSDGLLTYLGPHLFDAGPPYWSTDKLSNLPVEPCIIGSHSFNIPILARAIFEANSYAVRRNVEQLETISGIDLDYLNFCGGNSKSDFWMQIQADVLGKPVHVPLVNDSTAVGAAILASIGTGYYSTLDKAVNNMVNQGKVFEPRKSSNKKYDKHYMRWIKTREKLGKL